MTHPRRQSFWHNVETRSSNPLLWAFGACLLVIFTERQAVIDLWGAWQTEEYSHGILIPFISALLAWHQLVKAKPALNPSWLGILFLFTAGLFEATSKLSAFDTIAEYGIILSFVGISLSFLGRKATYVIIPSLIYLIFAVPLPHLFQAGLSQDLQLLSSNLGVMPLDLFGIPVYQEGNVIDLGGYRLQVVDACNGLRYLFPLLSFGYLIAYLLKDCFWKRAILFLSTIPITIAMNALRIAFIGITVDLWGSKMAEGFLHDFEGWTVFVLCLAILMGETWILLHIGKKGHFRYEYFFLPKGKLFSKTTSKKVPQICSVLILFILAFIFGSKVMDRKKEIIPSHPAFISFPLELGDWHGRQDHLPSEILEALKLSDYWIAEYVSDSEQGSINLYMAYYDSQRVGVTTHSPSNCIPGGGFQIEKSDVREIPVADGKTVKLTRLVIRKDDAAQIVYYWFDERGRDLTETYSAKWYLLIDSIIMHRSDGALIRISTGLDRNEPEASGDMRLSNFLAKIDPKLDLFIPGNR